MNYGTTTGSSRGRLVEFKTAAAETVSTTHSLFNVEESGCLSVVVNVTAASGTTPTLTVVVEGSDDGATWFQLGVVGAGGYSVGTTASAPTNLTVAAVGRGAFPAPAYVRTRSVVGGTTPSFTYSVRGSIS